jgi:DNA-binding transcriptional LysR family regulator
MALDIATAMRVFTAVVDSGSFVGAADKLSVSPGMVTRYVAQLEAHLGVRLLHRTTRKLSLTEEGSDYYQRSLQIIASIEDAELSATKGRVDPHGILRITMASSLGLGHLDRAIADYLQRHPNIEVDLMTSERMVDLVDEGFDLALRVTKEITPGLVARRIAPVSIIACASPEYLEAYGSPKSPEDLAGHNCLLYPLAMFHNKWRFCLDGVEQFVPVKGNLRVNNGNILVSAALAGMGIIYEPDFHVAKYVKRGRLVQILKEWETVELSLFAVYANRQFLPLKVRSFIDFLVDYFGPQPYWRLPK